MTLKKVGTDKNNVKENVNVNPQYRDSDISNVLYHTLSCTVSPHMNSIELNPAPVHNGSNSLRIVNGSTLMEYNLL
jgi:hypothetical protein